VTVAPATGVYDKCQQNVEEGYRVYLLVPDRSMVGARQNAELAIPGRVTVQSIESFVGQNLDELATFSRREMVGQLHRLLETYNERVNQTEKDKSMLIEIPRNLLPHSEKP